MSEIRGVSLATMERGEGVVLSNALCGITDDLLPLNHF